MRIVLTAAFSLTWAFFPEIGNSHTTLALGPWVSYLWPIALIWFVLFAERKTEANRMIEPTLRGKVDDLPSFAYMILWILLGATWGFGVWHAIVTSESRFISEFLPFFVAVIGILPVLGFYYGSLLATTLVFVVCVTRFIPRATQWFVNEPVSESDFSSSSDSSSSDARETLPLSDLSESEGESNNSDETRYNTNIGVIYQGDGTFGLGLAVGCYEDGNIYRGDGTFGLGLAVGRYEDGYIYRGDATFGLAVARYVGPDEGGAAAAMILGLLA